MKEKRNLKRCEILSQEKQMKKEKLNEWRKKERKKEKMSTIYKQSENDEKKEIKIK